MYFVGTLVVFCSARRVYYTIVLRRGAKNRGTKSPHYLAGNQKCNAEYALNMQHHKHLIYNALHVLHDALLIFATAVYLYRRNGL